MVSHMLDEWGSLRRPGGGEGHEMGGAWVSASRLTKHGLDFLKMTTKLPLC